MSSPGLVDWGEGMKFTRGMLLVAVVASIFLGAASGYAQTQPTSITISPQNPTLTVGQTQQFTAQSGSPLDFGESTAVAAGRDHTCAVLASGAAKCWGNNLYGQLGNGSLYKSTTPVKVSGLSAAVSITAGYEFTCALLSGGTAQCWGYNNNGQLGDGSFSPTWSTTPVTVSGLGGAVSIAAGHAHACALLANGTVNCWGDNSYGQLGNGPSNPSPSPVPTLDLVPSLVWTSSDTSVATIDPTTGFATAKASGSTTITVTYGILSAQTTLTVP